MKIKFNQDVQLEVITHYDEEQDKAFTEDAYFKNGEEVDVALLSGNEVCISVQFGDGSCCYGIPTECFEITEIDEEEKVIFD